MMVISFENKVALAAGAGSGLGFATANAFPEAGQTHWHGASAQVGMVTDEQDAR